MVSSKTYKIITVILVTVAAAGMGFACSQPVFSFGKKIALSGRTIEITFGLNVWTKKFGFCDVTATGPDAAVFAASVKENFCPTLEKLDIDKLGSQYGSSKGKPCEMKQKMAMIAGGLGGGFALGLFALLTGFADLCWKKHAKCFAGLNILLTLLAMGLVGFSAVSAVYTYHFKCSQPEISWATIPESVMTSKLGLQVFGTIGATIVLIAALVLSLVGTCCTAKQSDLDYDHLQHSNYPEQHGQGQELQ